MVWPPNKRLLLWTIGAVIALLILGSIGAGLWVVLREYIQPKTPTDKLALVNIFVVSAAGLVGIPTALAAVGSLYVSRRNLEQQRELDDQRAQDEALQAYLDRIGNLLFANPLDKDTSSGPFEVSFEVRTQARAHTLTILRGLDPRRKRNVLGFLYESDLIKKPEPVIVLGSPDSGYSAADLSGADLKSAVLREVVLSGTRNGVNLSGADLRGADLTGADLSRATLRGADLSGAVLSSVFSGEDPVSGGIVLHQTDLTGADLNGVLGVTNEEVEQQSGLLEGATMPNGQKYEDWLKSRGEDGENGGPS